MSHRLFESVGATIGSDVSKYVRIYDQATGSMRCEPVKIVHIYTGVYGKTAAHQARRWDPKWDRLFAVLDLIEPVVDDAHQRQWIMTVDEFKELASLDKENHHGRRTTARTDGEGSRHR